MLYSYVNTVFAAQHNEQVSEEDLALVAVVGNGIGSNTPHPPS
jgi:hypothetical protein